MMKKRILVVDRYELVHAAVSLALASRESCVLLPPALSLSAAMRQIALRVPDLIILDPYQPDTAGILPTLRELHPRPGLLVLTENDNPDDVQLTLMQGVDGYILKSTPVRDLENAIESILQGQKFLHPRISHFLLDRRDEFSLTKRQEEVLTLIAEGRTVKQIAGMLGVSAKTVESHRVALMNRLGIHHVAGLVQFAIRRGYLQLSASAGQKMAQ